MPNHMYQRMTVTGDPADVDAFLSSIASSHSAFDFNNVIPMPQSLDITDDSRSIPATIEYIKAVNPANPYHNPKYPKFDPALFKQVLPLASSNFRKIDLTDPNINDTILDTGKIFVDNFINYGFTTWFGWRNHNWNTKWNAYDIEIERPKDTTAVIKYSTAWSVPYPIIDKLSTNNKNVTISLVFCEEDIGAFAGLIKYDHGVASFADIGTDCSAKAIYYACRFFNADYTEHDLVFVPGFRQIYFASELMRHAYIPRHNDNYCILNYDNGKSISITQKLDKKQHSKAIKQMLKKGEINPWLIQLKGLTSDPQIPISQVLEKQV